MADKETQAEVIHIPAERLEEAAEVLARAFEDDPIMRFFFPEDESGRGERLRALFRLSCRIRLVLGEPLLGAVMQGRLAGVACVSAPEEKPWPGSLEQAWEACRAQIGERAAGQLERYEQLHATHRLAAPHFYLIAIGVRPEAQGKGCGGALLRAVSRLAESHPDAAGVGLDTATPANVTLYERFGYQVRSEGRLDDLVLWFMHRPNAARSE